MIKWFYFYFRINILIVPRFFSSLNDVILKFFRFTLCKPEKFSGYNMETGNFTVYVTETGKISKLRSGVWKFYGFHSVIRKISGLRHANCKHSGFHLIRNFIRNATLRNKFPDHSISKMEILFRNNDQLCKVLV